VCCHDRRHGGRPSSTAFDRDHQNTLRQASTPIVPFLDDEILRPFAIDTVIIQSGLVDIGHL
jgi:hypothetical protein